MALILIIASYNAQVFEIQQRVSAARVGTVDKFQGQEAPIAIYSLTSSSHDDAPRWDCQVNLAEVKRPLPRSRSHAAAVAAAHT